MILRKSLVFGMPLALLKVKIKKVLEELIEEAEAKIKKLDKSDEIL
jgi:hypothetical protein